MTTLEDYFAGQYVVRLKALKAKVQLRTPLMGSSNEVIKEFAGWLQKELDFFFAGTQGHLKDLLNDLELSTKYKLLVAEKFVHDYLQLKVTEDWIVNYVRGPQKKKK